MQRIIDAIDGDDVFELKPDKLPPIHLWNPVRVIENDMRINNQGVWFHEGGEISRLPLCQLFASILRLDGRNYFLVTPTEKFPIDVDDVPFLMVGVSRIKNNEHDALVFVNNLNQKLVLDGTHTFELRDYQGVQVPYICVRDQLFARVSRQCFYQLITFADHAKNDNDWYVSSMGKDYFIGSVRD